MLLPKGYFHALTVDSGVQPQSPNFEMLPGGLGKAGGERSSAVPDSWDPATARQGQGNTGWDFTKEIDGERPEHGGKGMQEKQSSPSSHDAQQAVNLTAVAKAGPPSSPSAPSASLTPGGFPCLPSSDPLPPVYAQL